MSAQSEKLVSDVKTLVSDSEELVKATLSQAGDRIVDIRSRTHEAVNKLKPQLVKLETAIADKTKTTITATDAYVRENPWTAIGMSAGIGLIIGLLFGRR
jgi:ElaB/YqjD/DUF883 family membrane-anchored ribosome-binding protein